MASKQVEAFLRRAAFVLIGAVLLRAFVFRVDRIESGSMEKTIMTGDLVVTSKLSYGIKVPFWDKHITWGSIRRGDIGTFYGPDDPWRVYVKRFVGLPGDVVEIRGGVVLVNGEPFREVETYVPVKEDVPPIRVPPGCYYVLGDNRGSSADSRTWGFLSRRLIIGRVVFQAGSRWGDL